VKRPEIGTNKASQSFPAYQVQVRFQTGQNRAIRFNELENRLPRLTGHSVPRSAKRDNLSRSGEPRLQPLVTAGPRVWPASARFSTPHKPR